MKILIIFILYQLIYQTILLDIPKRRITIKDSLFHTNRNTQINSEIIQILSTQKTTNIIQYETSEVKLRKIVSETNDRTFKPFYKTDDVATVSYEIYQKLHKFLESTASSESFEDMAINKSKSKDDKININYRKTVDLKHITTMNIKPQSSNFRLVPFVIDHVTDFYWPTDADMTTLQSKFPFLKSSPSTKSTYWFTLWPSTAAIEISTATTSSPIKQIHNKYWVEWWWYYWWWFSSYYVTSCYMCGINKTNMQNGIPLDESCNNMFDFSNTELPYSGQYVRSKVDCYFNYRTLSNLEPFVEEFRAYGPYNGGCFKRFLDYGNIFTERGCRSSYMPLVGNSIASQRFVKVELLLRNIHDGCVTSPFASLTPFSRSVSLYVRYHVCVCSKPYCNNSNNIKNIFYFIFLSFYLLIKNDRLY